MITTPLTKIVKKNNISFRKKSERVTKQQDFLCNPYHVRKYIHYCDPCTLKPEVLFFSANKILYFQTFKMSIQIVLL